MKMECIAIDDEPMALEVISRFCGRFGNIELHTYTNPLEGMRAVRERRPDILFMDIRMRGLNGLELSRRLPEGVNLIFTTAYKEYASEGFELEALDYLCKPFSYERFERGVRKVRERKEESCRNRELADETISVKSDYRDYKVRLGDIVYIESSDTYVRIHMSKGDTLMVRLSMKRLLPMLPPDHFVRIHKSFVVPVFRIVQHSRHEVVLNNGTRIPIGRTYADGVIGLLKKP